MPKNPNIRKVLVIGSGPIVIGQAAEFDYAGTQACRSLKEEGLEVVLVNSNPATIMTDVHIADRVYIARYANADETVLVPGKVLSNGDLTEKVNVAAFKFSQKAQEKIESAGGECVSIDDIMESNPKGSNIRIME